MRLLDALRGLGLSGRDARQALATGKVRLGATPTGDPNREVEAGDVRVDPNLPRCVPGRDAIVAHRGDGWVVVSKPAGMLSVPAPGRRDPHVIGFVARLYGDAYAVHRLDEETSGLILVALTESAQTWLKDRIEQHDVDREYLAIAAGAVRGDVTVRNALVRDRGDGLRGAGAGGKPAVTHFRVEEALRGATLVGARLETGRTHQVRIHLSDLGHPVLGDPLYAGSAGRHRAPRLALHARRLAFDDRSGARFAVVAPLPDDLERLRSGLSLTSRAIRR